MWKNLAIMVGVPYLKRKLDEGYDVHAAPQASLIMAGGGPQYRPPTDELPPNATLRQRLDYAYKWFLRNAYPTVNAGYHFSVLVFNLAYLFDNTKFSSPFLWIIGSRIRRLSSADHRAIAEVLDPKPGPAGAAAGRARRRPGSGLLGLLSPQNLYPQLLASLRYFLPASIFALKFLEWWHASDFSRHLARKATEMLDLPAPVVKGMVPPGERSKAEKETEKEKEDKGKTEQGKEKELKSALKTRRLKPPVSATSYLPIFTVPLPPTDTDNASTCPICLGQLANPTACQTGYVFCYVCVFHWLNGENQRQVDFMSGEGAGAWEDEDEKEEGSEEKPSGDNQTQSREGKWESGQGRCPVTGRKVLSGTEGLRRVLI